MISKIPNKTMIKNFVITISSLSFLLFLFQSALACSCSFSDNLSAKVPFSSSDTVFIGKVLEIRNAGQATVFLMNESDLLKLSESSKRRGFIVTKIQTVKLEVIEPFKGIKEKTVQLSQSFYNGGGSCGVNFKVGKSYLVFANKKQPMLSKDEAEQPKENWTKEMLLKSEADKFNEPLPPFETNICMRTDRLSFTKEEVQEIRSFQKNGVWIRDKELPTRILY